MHPFRFWSMMARNWLDMMDVMMCLPPAMATTAWGYIPTFPDAAGWEG